MDVDRILGKAEDEAKRKNFDYAIRLYQEILAIKPDLVPARRGLRQATLKKFAKKYPSKSAAKMKGMSALVSIRTQRVAKRHLALLQTCEKYLQHDPKNLQVLTILGEAAIGAKFLDTAILAYEDIAELHPQEADALKALGDLYHQKGRIDDAIAAYERALAVRPHDAEIIKARKNLAAEGAIRTSGIENATHSRQLVKDKDELARIEARKRLVKSPKELEEAIAAEEAALKENPEDVKAIRSLAELYYQKGDVDEAIEVLEEALEVRPDSEDLKTRIGDWKLRRSASRVEALEREGNAEALGPAREADHALRVEEYQRRVDAHPTDLGNRYKLGSAQLDSGDIDGAIAQFQQTIRDPKHRLESLLKLGDCFFRKKMYDLAAKQLLEALEAAGSGAPNRVLEIQYTLGEVHEANGNTSAALDAFSRVYEKDIQYRDVAEKIHSLGSANES